MNSLQNILQNESGADIEMLVVVCLVFIGVIGFMYWLYLPEPREQDRLHIRPATRRRLIYLRDRARERLASQAPRHGSTTQVLLANREFRRETPLERRRRSTSAHDGSRQSSDNVHVRSRQSNGNVQVGSNQSSDNVQVGSRQSSDNVQVRSRQATGDVYVSGTVTLNKTERDSADNPAVPPDVSSTDTSFAILTDAPVALSAGDPTVIATDNRPGIKEVLNVKSAIHQNIDVCGKPVDKANADPPDAEVLIAGVAVETGKAKPVVKDTAARSEPKRQMDIERLLHDGKLACEDQTHWATAKDFATQALALATKEKNTLIQSNGHPLDRQLLAGWFGDCAFIFNKIGEPEQAIRSFYTATVFDGNWQVEEHSRVSGILWNALVCSQPTYVLRKRYVELKQLLTEMDNIAKLAEKQGRWHVCIMITNEVQNIFTFLSHRHGLGPRDITKIPVSQDGIRRAARCAYQTRDHEGLKRLCQIIQKDFSEYDDVDAFELEARSFQRVGEYQLALKDVEQALLSCQDDSVRSRLRQLHSELVQQVKTMANPSSKEPSEDWLEGTAAAADERTSSPNGSPAEHKKKKKHRRPKAMNPSPDIDEVRATLQAESRETPGHKKTKAADTSNDTDEERETVVYNRVIADGETVADRRNPDNSPSIGAKTTRRTNRRGRHYDLPRAGSRARTRTCSGSSGSAADTGMNPDFNFDSFSVATLSDSDFSDDTSMMDTQEITELDEDIQSDSSDTEDESTFYEKSCRLHLNDECQESIECESKTETLLKYGLQLNKSYMARYDDRRQDVIERDAFYNQLPYTVEQLEEMLLKQPDVFKRCTIQVERAHMATCIPKDSGEKISVIEISGRSKAGQTFDEDEVVVKLLDTVHENKDRRYGEVVGKLKRHRHKDIEHPVFICTLDDLEAHLVRPMCKTLPKIHILNFHILENYKQLKKYKVEIYDYDDQSETLEFNRIIDITPANREKCIFLVAYLQWSPQHIYPRGAVIKVLPFGETVRRGLAILNLQNEVPGLYTKSTVERVEAMSRRQVSDDLDEVELRGRTDFTTLNTFTVDPPGCRDIDDALSIERLEGGYKVGVHIADVTSKVSKDDPLDNEAKRRGTTYYPKIRQPRHMLPEPLSSRLCSLQENKKRLTISVMFNLDSHGKLMQMQGNAFEILRSYISSRRQFTYEEVQKIIDGTTVDEQLELDIQDLARLTKKIRYERLGNAMYAVDVEEMDSFDEPASNCEEAHYLVEECMIMANKKIARELTRRFPQSGVPLRCQQPPSKEDMEEFVKRHDHLLDSLVCMQDKRICDYKTPSLDTILQHQPREGNEEKVFVSEANWAFIAGINMDASSRCIRTDDLHPLQHLIRQHWLHIQIPASYKCSSVGRKNESSHYSLDLECYTHFTSPIRRYIDIVIHRMVHAYIDRAPCPYSRNEVEDICTHVTSRMRRAKKYEKGCKALQQALDYKQKQKAVIAYVDDISDRELTLSSRNFRHVEKQFRELPFSLLNVSSKPEVSDQMNKPQSVTVTWTKRLYDIKQSSDPSDRGNIHRLNPMRNIVSVPLVSWAQLLKCSLLGHTEDLRRAISNTTVTRNGYGRDDVSTECLDVWKIRPVTKFSLKYESGQAVCVQMSAEARKGILAPRPVLYNLTNNVKYCLDHMEDPVRHLYNYSTKATTRKYQTVKEYISKWIPLISMQAAVSAVKNEESFVINNLPITFTGPRAGRFALYIDYCAIRNLDFSGTEVILDDGEEEASTSPMSYDWLCIKQIVPIIQKQKGVGPADTVHENIIVYHAEVTNVKKKKSDDHSRKGKVVISFKLHKDSSNIPDFATSDATKNGAELKKQTNPVRESSSKYSVEVLKKTETDRRTESILQQFPGRGSKLAKAIALNNKPFPKQKQRDGILTARDIDDFFYGNLPDTHKLPKNNTKQEEAIDKAATSEFTLIQGPPGTGKTYTGVKLIFLFNKMNQYSHEKLGKPKRHVLFCGPSNKSVDLVARLLIKRLGPLCPKFVRVYGRTIEGLDFPVPGRTFTYKKTKDLKVDESLKEVALHHVIRQKDKPYAEKLKSYDRLFAAKDYQIDSEDMFEDIRKYLKLIRDASIEEIKENDVILCTTAVGSNPKVLEGANVHQIMIDEAGMCTEPECLVPIVATEAEQVVLIGDHKQLRPIVTCTQAAELGMEKSLFERYADLTEAQDCKNVEFTMLEIQYRMHPNICRFPSKMFYEEQLKTGHLPWDIMSKENDRLFEIWPFDRWGMYPHVLIHVEGEEQILTVSTDEGNENSRSNAAEVKQVLTVFRYMIDNGISAEQINVMSQYNAQCSEIRKALTEQGFANFTVSTVVSSQGGEWDYVIFSTVRSLPDYKIERNPTLGWCKSNLGFIVDRNQVNVALTRAHKGLIIIGNRELLKCDYVWKRLISHYEQRNCLKTPQEFPPPRKSRQQIMEENKLRNEIRYGATMFEKGQATSYEGSFDFEEESRPGHFRRANQRGRGGRGNFRGGRRRTFQDNVVPDSDDD